MKDFIERLEAALRRIAELEAALQSEKDEVFRLQCSHSALYARVQELEAERDVYNWGYEYLQHRMHSIDRHGWAIDCDDEIAARIDALKEKQ